MDINVIKTWAKNKIESDDLAKQVRRGIKEPPGKKRIREKDLVRILNL